MRRVSILILALSVLLIFSGCGQPARTNKGNEADQALNVTSNDLSESIMESNKEIEKEEVPEPLRLASEQLVSGNVDRAKTYLELTINDFKGTDAEFTAVVIKSIILASESRSYTYLQSSLGKGIDNLAISLVEKNDFDRLETTYTESARTKDELLIELEGTVKYIFDNYKEHLNDELQGLKFESKVVSSPSDLSFFEDVGYPVPTESQMNDTRVYAFEQLLSRNLNEVISVNKINYINLFYLAGLSLIGLEESEVLESVMNEVLTLTENDKYNEKRIDVQEFLNSKK
ncbi:hypothetical protein MKX50_16405 [Paenibacillus sp. FSL W8-0186]|uniref:Lipoprotein n=1 Tax=Paenibacillus woosongensis TaxID=307580 RepID=A0ABQ4MPC4_9BACL|nr:hypothetical protein [Paenibacillus woosongensis]GIP57841.1 hypothetical protein J15TS10_16550 [Paenibacillus woosongensis]